MNTYTTIGEIHMIVKVRYNFEEHTGEANDAQTAFEKATEVMLSQLPQKPENTFYATVPNDSRFGGGDIRAMKVIRMTRVNLMAVRADDFEFPFFVKVCE